MTHRATDLPRVGFQVWSQSTTWPELARTARDIERLGFNSLWSNDHFFPPAGTGAASAEGLDGPVLEGWMTLAGFASETSSIPLGVMVSGAGYRNPGLLVKMATALDHISGGRMSLGLGAGWHERDHHAFGFELPPIRQRLDRLDEQAAAVRALRDGDEVTTSGRWVCMERARNDPAPLGPLPLMIGGSGERRTLRIVARDADAWNGEGDVATFAHKSGVLDGHCAAIGRDPAAIRRTVGLPPPHLRATRAEAIASLSGILEHNGYAPGEAATMAADDPFADTLDAALPRLAAYKAAGADEVMFDWPAPFDTETLERLSAVLVAHPHGNGWAQA